MVQSPIGFRIRSRRKALALTQAELAKRAGISPSYLNLIEANKREIGGALLIKIAALLDLEMDALSGQAERRMIDALSEIAHEPIVRHLAPSPSATPELVGRHPDWARTLLVLHRAWQDQAAVAGALSDRLNQDPVLGDAVHQMLTQVTTIRSSSEILDELPPEDERRLRFGKIVSEEVQRLSQTAESLAGLFDPSGTVTQAATPAGEADDFLVQNNTWFPTLEKAGERIRQNLGDREGHDDAGLKAYLDSKHGIPPLSTDREVAANDGAVQLTPHPADSSPAARRFHLARRIAQIEAEAAVEALVDDPSLTSDVARDTVRHELNDYVAGAILLPYEAFLRAAIDCRYDVETLCRCFDASHGQIFHRLVTLRDPDRAGVPFAFLKANQAGYISKRSPLPRLPLVRHGHACPLWAIFTSFQTPARTVRMLAEFPDGARYLMIARAVAKGGATFHETPVMEALMLICDQPHADQTVYAEGLDLSSKAKAIPVGPSCRTCPRADCGYRGEAPIV